MADLIVIIVAFDVVISIIIIPERLSLFNVLHRVGATPPMWLDEELK